MARTPIVLNFDGQKPAVTPVTAAPVPEADEVVMPESQAMLSVASFMTRRQSRLGRWFWGLLLALIGMVVSVSIWDFTTALVARSSVLGYMLTGLIGLFLLVLVLLAIREIVAIARLSRIDQLQSAARQAQNSETLSEARHVTQQLVTLYATRPEMQWARNRFIEFEAEQVDATSLLELAELELLSGPDEAAIREIEHAARQVATVTALVPLALADIVAALTSNLRMIRRIAEIYGGRAGVLGSWRLTRAVLAHLVATGAVAVGDDLLEPLIGGGILAKLSRRFGEGIVNGALTARVGVAALEVCRPLPFMREKRPSASSVIKRALSGLLKG